ncbi:DUF992 domain-containing protein [Labrenzia sp. 5N]|nr:DUF992 domain-containing protein [Labrenzia sp. 5N]
MELTDRADVFTVMKADRSNPEATYTKETLMTRFTKLALTLTGATLLATPVMAQDKPAGVEVGKLTCVVEQETNFIVGSKAVMNCTFDRVGDGPASYYTATVSEYGLDIGTTDSATLIWGVVAPTADLEVGALEGEYAGVTAGASLGAGIKANALIGGFDKSIALNPLSVESQTGTNITVGVSRMSLEAIK